jgi:PhzF family phenazine biosynthesis protein
MKVLRLAAFCDGDRGGNPAGVVIGDRLPPAAEMQKIAAEVGYSETVFAAPLEGGWRVRYFSPIAEVPFCGHATIALGAALALQEGEGCFPLTLNHARITVEGHRDGDQFVTALQSPPPWSRPVEAELVQASLALFGYGAEDLDPRLPPARLHAGADHLLLALQSRLALAAMHYDPAAGERLMREAGLLTILLAWAESPQRFHCRNAGAAAGIVEDPATGAATAALGGYLRDLGWPHGGVIEVMQGEDMGCRSLLRAEIPPLAGASIRVSGTVRWLQP